ncbi:MAG: hypothetical protein AAFQ12_03545 [Pseudomonadota bacterium]
MTSKNSNLKLKTQMRAQLRKKISTGRLSPELESLFSEVGTIQDYLEIRSAFQNSDTFRALYLSPGFYAESGVLSRLHEEGVPVELMADLIMVPNADDIDNISTALLDELRHSFDKNRDAKVPHAVSTKGNDVIPPAVIKFLAAYMMEYCVSKNLRVPNSLLLLNSYSLTGDEPKVRDWLQDRLFVKAFYQAVGTLQKAGKKKLSFRAIAKEMGVSHSALSRDKLSLLRSEWELEQSEHDAPREVKLARGDYTMSPDELLAKDWSNNFPFQ